MFQLLILAMFREYHYTKEVCGVVTQTQYLIGDAQNTLLNLNSSHLCWMFGCKKYKYGITHIKVKVKQTLSRPITGPEGSRLRLPDFMIMWHMKVVRLSALHTSRP